MDAARAHLEMIRAEEYGQETCQPSRGAQPRAQSTTPFNSTQHAVHTKLQNTAQCSRSDQDARAQHESSMPAAVLFIYYDEENQY